MQEKPLQYVLWMKRAADGSRMGGIGRTNQLRLEKEIPFHNFHLH